ILLELKPWLEAQLNPATFQSKPVVDQSVKVKNTFDKSYLDLLKVVGYDPAPIDQIAQKIDLPTASLASMLLRLELEGYVSQDALGYIKIKEIQ
ncbi:MAG: hypothetical protein EBX40_08150, partial [Gammaproteobacteria bacterium]|nr:hypothetical protein [Gammaproteobacteria bacterium]